MRTKIQAMPETKIVLEVRDFVLDLMKSKLPQEVVYHNFSHTSHVVNTVTDIAVAESLAPEDKEILQLAAWLHDVGYIKGYENHEEESALIAKEFLAKKDFPPEKIAKITACILVTKMPQNPKNNLEEIMCDADLEHLSSDNFSTRSNLLRSELEQFCDMSFSDIEWLKKNEKFLKEHNYFTNYALINWSDLKTKNWLKVQKDLRKTQSKKAEQEIKNKTKNENLKLKKAKGDSPDRGIQTMYRVTLRNHIKLSDIADTKANILLSVSAIILSIALSTLFPKLDKASNEYLIFPTLLFLTITVVTMIFSILSTRPKVTSGKFTKEDVANRKVNLLFFGNFHKMPLKTFQDGMVELMNDKEYLYESLMKDLYYLGIVLNKKYKLLRIAYNIFMYGIVLTVIAFVYAFRNVAIIE